MPGKGLTIAAAVLAVLAGLLWWSNREKAQEAAKPPADTTPKLISIPDADIQQVELKKRDGVDTILKRSGAGKWELTAPKAERADQDAANGLVSSAATVTSDKLVEDKATNLKEFGLTNPTLEVQVTPKKGGVLKLLLGDDAPGGNGTYAMKAGDSRVFTVASFTKTSLDKTENDLRDKRLLTVDQDKLSRVELDSKKGDIEFGRSKDAWEILKPKPMRADGLQVEELVRKLKDAKMDSGTSEDDQKKAAAAFAAGTPVATVKVTDNTGTQELQLHKKGDDYYAKSSVVEGAYKVAADLGTGVDKSVDDFRNKKLFDFGFTEPSKIELHDNAKTYSFQKSGEKWMSNGKEMDSTSVQSFLDKLRDLSASKFVDTGFGAPQIDIAVTSDGGKRIEKLQVAKSADGDIAKRENEPSLYFLDQKTVDDLLRAAGDVKPAQAAKK